MIIEIMNVTIGMKYQVFLAIDGKTGYLLSADTGNPLCPCCLDMRERQDIECAIRIAKRHGWLEGKVRWISPQQARYGENVWRHGFLSSDFCHAAIEEMPAELRAELGQRARVMS